jgi:mRNA interferase ChpB
MLARWVESCGEPRRDLPFPVVLPITHGGDFARRLGFAVALSGTKTTRIVLCDQPRVLDLAARHAQNTERLPERPLATS